MSGDPNGCERTSFASALAALGPLSGVREVPANGTFNGAPNAVYRGLYVGTSGDVTIETEEGQQVTLKSLAAGLWHGVFFVKILSATAANILVGR